MAKVKLTTPDRRMLDLIELLKEAGTIRYRQEFVDAIGMQKQNIRRIEMGLQHFTAVQISRACEAYGVNANWIMGIENDRVFNPKRRLVKV